MPPDNMVTSSEDKEVTREYSASDYPPSQASGPQGAKMSVGRYLATRVPTLKPPMHKAPNPFKLLAMLNFQQWMFFLVAFFAWTWGMHSDRLTFGIQQLT